MRRAVLRRVWRDNPHSRELATVAVGLARLLDAGDDRPQLRSTLRLTMSHLVDCKAQPDDVDDVRAQYCTGRLALFRRPYESA